MCNNSGIGTYIKNLVSEISEINKKDNFILYGMNNEFLISNNMENIQANIPIYTVKEQLLFYKMVTETKLDLLHVPHYNIPVLYRGKIVTTIHDIIHIKFPQFLPNKFAYYYAKNMLNIAVKKCDKIITGSENTKKDLIEHFNADEKKIEVIYYGVSKKINRVNDINLIESFKDKYNITKRYILYVGNVMPHKNILGLIEAFRNVYKINQNINLLIVGKYHKSMGKIQEDEGIIFTGFVSDFELSLAYSGASLFVFPSLYEGFGLPILEAMQYGIPVICSNTSSIPEVAGKAALLFNPYDIEDISKAILDVLNNENLKYKLIEKGYERTNMFDWKKSAERTLEVYEEILKRE